MKKTILFVLSCFVIAAIHSQNIVKEHYTVSGGIIGAANFSKFRITENNPTNVDYNTKAGWSAGGWLNFPVSNSFSIEPQVMHSSYQYLTKSTTPVLLSDGKIRYISVPVILKFDLSDKFALTAGPQIDFTSSVENNAGSHAQENDFKQTSFSAFGGVEILPHGRVTIFGRYIHGFTNMNASEASSAMVYKNSNIQAGLKLKLFGSKKTESTYQAASIPVIVDTDGDGINDDVDKCPNEKGIAKYNGCPIPDTDGDGINDELDKCPAKAGIAKYDGCPIPDSDSDGINDEEDKCPNKAGIAKYDGCPIPDRDNDGINDEEDKCPDVPGVAAKEGCPEPPVVEVSEKVTKSLTMDAQKIKFTGNTTKLVTTSNAALNDVVKMMNENPEMKIKIEGHTDNAGDDDANMKLSADRAAAVKTYLVSKGISEDRISTEGFGETMPVGDNNTTAGRTKNRRVEIKVVY